MKKFKLLKGFFAFLLAFALVTTAMPIMAKADTAPAVTEVKTVTYDPYTDTITSTVDAVVYVLKSADGVTVKAKDASVAITKDEPVKLSTFQKSTAKDAYLYIVSDKLTADKEGAKPTLTVKGQGAKKVTGTIDYTKSDSPATLDGVINVVALSKEGQEIKNPTIIWSDKVDGTYYDITSSEEVTLDDGSKIVAGFNGGKIAEYYGQTIYIKMLGDPNTRTSVAYKVKLAKQGKAPSVKVDVKKNTISLKNGMDFAPVTVEGKGDEAVYTVGAWTTILPNNKDAVNSAVKTNNYLPAEKKNETALAAKDGALSFTKAKVKAIAISEFLGDITSGKTADGASYLFAVRTSATTKKPASAYTVYTLATPAGNPGIYTLENAAKYVVIAEADTVAFVAPKMVNYASAWTGIGADVAPSKAAETVVDEAPAAYEFAVVSKADLAANKIDLTTIGWKAIKEKTKINEKTATAYVLTDGTKQKVNLTGDGKTYILIRRAGKKDKTINGTILPSEILYTEVKNVNKKYQWVVTNPADAIGAEAVTLTVDVKTWTQDKETKTYDYTVDASKQIVKYFVKDSDTREYTLPEAEGYVYYNEDGDAVVAGAKLSVDTSKNYTATVTLKQISVITVNETEQKKSEKEIYCVGDKDVKITLPSIPDGKIISAVKLNGTALTALAAADEEKGLAKGDYVIAEVDKAEMKVEVVFADKT